MAYRYFKSLALVSIAFSATQTKATYLTITTESCGSHGYEYVEDIRECQSAGQLLGQPWGNAQNYGHGDFGSAYPRGCFFKNNLALNHNQASPFSCSSEYTCICRAAHVTITTGTCGSRGYQYIDDVEECRSAGQQLGDLLGFTVEPYGITDLLSHPRGCFFGSNLAFNYNQASERICDDTNCICKVRTGCTVPVTTTSVIATLPMTTTTTTVAAKATTTIKETTKFLVPKTTLTSTTSGPSSSCTYVVHANTAVKMQDTGGKKLKRASYRSDAAYLDACKAGCNGDSKCKGFVDDPTDRRGRMCKPKTATVGYHKLQKAFHVKGAEC